MKPFALPFAALPALGGPARAAESPAFAFTAIPDQDETRLAGRFGKVAA